MRPERATSAIPGKRKEYTRKALGSRAFVTVERVLVLTPDQWQLG